LRSIDRSRRTPNLPAFQPCSSHSRPNPLDNQILLKFSDRTNYDDHRSTERTARIDLLSETDEFNIQVIQLV
jgi:hypothetical protein